jgi:hypothetical protein
LAALFVAGFLVAVFAAFAASALFSAHRFFVAAMIAFLPAAERLCLGLEGSGLALNAGLECFTVGSFAFREDVGNPTTSFARVTAAFAS